MTEAVNDRRTQVTATASQTVFTYDFKIRASSELNVYRREVADDTITLLGEGGGADDWGGITGVGDDNGGTYTLVTPATADDLFIAVGVTPEAKESDYVDDLEPATLNGDFDEIYRILNEHKRLLDLCIRMPLTDDEATVTGAGMELADFEARASKGLAFDVNGAVALSESGSADMTGPASSTDNAIARFNLATGKVVQNSTITLGDTGEMSAASGSFTLDNVRLVKDFTAQETLAAGDLCYYTGSGGMAKANATAEATADTMLAIALEAITATNTGSFLLMGEFTTTGLTDGSPYYVGETAGAITLTQPTTTGDIVRHIGTAIATTTLMFKPSSTFVEVV